MVITSSTLTKDEVGRGWQICLWRGSHAKKPELANSMHKKKKKRRKKRQKKTNQKRNICSGLGFLSQTPFEWPDCKIGQIYVGGERHIMQPCSRHFEKEWETEYKRSERWRKKGIKYKKKLSPKVGCSWITQPLQASAQKAQWSALSHRASERWNFSFSQAHFHLEERHSKMPASSKLWWRFACGGYATCMMLWIFTLFPPQPFKLLKRPKAE